MSRRQTRETDLYPAIKRLLEDQGYEVKAEIGAADVVGCRANESPVIVELKTGFSLTLFHQALARQAVTDEVYVAVPRGKGRAFARALKNNKTLCRRLGLGLITVRMKDAFVEVHLDPAPCRARKSARKRTLLLREFSRRSGDPNSGGTAGSIMTAYRQDALRCLSVLCENGPTKAACVAAASNVPRARRIMADDHYGWFERTQTRGVYTLTPKGEQAVVDFATDLAALTDTAGER